jgi:hypothetical protein
MSRRATLPVLCAAALTLAAVPGLARVGVIVGIAPARSCGRASARPAWPRLRLAAGLLELERRPVRLGARCIRHGPLHSRGMGPRSLGQGMAPARCGSAGTGGGEAGWSHASDAAGQEEPPRAILSYN